MTHFFLRSRHYVLFLPLILPTICSFAFQFFLSGWLSDLQQRAGTEEDLSALFDFAAIANYRVFFLLYLAVFASSVFVRLGWLYSVAAGLRKYLPAGVRLSTSGFQLAFGVLYLYYALLLIGQYLLIDNFTSFASFAEVEAYMQQLKYWLTGSPFLLLCTVFFAIVLVMAAMLYLSFYTGKTLRCIEAQRPLRGSDVAGYTVLSYFLVIGVWVFQPKIRRLLEQGSMQAPEEPSPW